MSAPDAAETAWKDGPFRQRSTGVTFGAMYEDAAIELRAFAAGSRVLCISAAGCTARALAAAGHHVTAVDIDPRQIAYAEAREEGQPPQQGSVERLMALGRQLLALCGWTRSKVTAFLELSDTAEQLAYWDRHLDTRAWRLVVDTLLSPRLLALRYAHAMLQELPQDFGPQMRKRLRRGFGSHGNSGNPYAALLLLGVPPAETGAPQGSIRFVCSEAAAYLERCTPGSFDAFSLSNISDGASPGFQQRLSAAVAGAAAEGAVVVRRSFLSRDAEQYGDSAEDWTQLDRSLLWGSVRVNRIGKEEACSTA